MVILHVVAPGEAGGLESVVRSLAVGQRRRGHETHVALVLDGPDPPLVGQLLDASVTVHRLVLPRRRYWRERAAIARVLESVAPDVVHSHGYRADLVDAPVARQLGLPTVTPVHGFCSGGWRNRLYEAFQRTQLRHFDSVVAVSRPLADALVEAGVPAQRVSIVRNAWWPNGAPLDREAARSMLGAVESRFLVGWVGRLGREKGADVLIRAIPHLTDIPVTVSFIGDGEERERLQNLAARLGVSLDIEWHGMLPDAARLFRAFDVFVLSSRAEGTPISLLEAMAAGVPVVATAVGGVPDMLSPAEALLVQPERPVELADAVRAVAENRPQAAARAQRAQERLCRDFDGAEWLVRYEELYHSLGPRGTVRQCA